MEYLVKWLGYPDSENSWVKDEDVLDRDLIASFEACQDLHGKGSRRRSKAHEVEGQYLPREVDKHNHPVIAHARKDGIIDCEHGFHVREVLGAKRKNDELVFLVSWYELGLRDQCCSSS